MKKIIELKNISKSFDGDVVLDNISLDIYDNEFLTLLGPSGCGKTTTLRIISGFVQPDEGEVVFMGEDITDIPPHKRNVNSVGLGNLSGVDLLFYGGFCHTYLPFLNKWAPQGVL